MFYLYLELERSIEMDNPRYKSYESFKSELDGLSDEKWNIIMAVLLFMEHKIDKKEVDIASGIEIARKSAWMSENELYEAILKKCPDLYGCEKKAIESIKSTFDSMIRNHSFGSKLLPVILDILGIDEIYLIRNSLYFQEKQKDIEWLYSTISDYDKDVLGSLLSDLQYGHSDIYKCLTSPPPDTEGVITY